MFANHNEETCVVLQLVQSLEMLQLLGVNRVVIYKTSCSPETQRVLDYYTNKGWVCYFLNACLHRNTINLLSSIVSCQRQSTYDNISDINGFLPITHRLLGDSSGHQFSLHHSWLGKQIPLEYTAKTMSNSQGKWVNLQYSAVFTYYHTILLFSHHKKNVYVEQTRTFSESWPFGCGWSSDEIEREIPPLICFKDNLVCISSGLQRLEWHDISDVSGSELSNNKLTLLTSIFPTGVRLLLPLSGDPADFRAVNGNMSDTSAICSF